jgi:outer membrane protein assembly factor BamB
VSPAADRVIAYDPKTGKEDWIVRYPGFSNVPRPIFGNGLIYVCTGYMTPQLWAIRPDGSGDVTDSHVAWKVTKQVPAKPSPILVGKELYMVSDQGICTCLDALTGAELWKERFGGAYTASPVFVDGHVFFFDEKGKTTVLKPGRKFEEAATNELDSGFKASAAIAGKAFYLRTLTHLYRIEQPGK